MKKTIYFLTTVMFAGVTILFGCKTPDQKVENAEENVSDAKQGVENAEIEYAIAIQEFKKETYEKISVNEKRIAELKEAKRESESKTAKAEYKRKIEELEQRNSDLKKRLDDYNDNGKEGWESFKREFDHDMDELGKALKDLTVDNKN